MSDFTLINIGFNNGVIADKVVAILSPDSASSKRLRDEAREDHRLIDASQGRKTRSMIVMQSNHIILSSQTLSTLSKKLGGDDFNPQND